VKEWSRGVEKEWKEEGGEAEGMKFVKNVMRESRNSEALKLGPHP